MIQEITQKIAYPKLILLGLCIVLAYIFFQHHIFDDIAQRLNHYGYISMFLAGCLFSYGFTSPFAVGIFLALGDEVNILIGAPLAALGALLSDLLIFAWIRSSFEDEFKRLMLTRPFEATKLFFKRNLKPTFQKYLIWAAAGLIIGSPLPDEIGVSLLSGFSNINRKLFCFIDYTANVLGVTTFLLLGRI